MKAVFVDTAGWMGIVACLLAIGCGPTRTEPAAQRVLQAVPVNSPAGPNAAQPFLSTGRDGSLLLSWIERSEARTPHLRVAVRSDSGVWGTVHDVVESRALFINWADFPSVTQAGDGSLAVHWLEKTADAPYAYHVKLARSWDEGEHWTPGIVAHQDRSPVEHGFASLQPAGGSSLDVIWLDGRTTGQMGLRYARFEDAATMSNETVLDERVCDCCQTALVRTPKGLVAAYRDRSSDEIRDISVIFERGGRWSVPRPVAVDGWRIDGCPVNGPQLDALGDAVVIAWFAMPGDKPTVRAAFSNDGGETFGPPFVVDDGNPLGRVDVVWLDRDRAIVTWVVRQAEGARLRARIVAPGGAQPASIDVSDTTPLRESGFPRLARVGDDVFVAWTAAQNPTSVRLARIAERVTP